MAGPNLLTIPPGTPFLPVLAEALLSGDLVPARELGETVVYLPTREAARGLEAALAARVGRPLLLPRITALGEVGGAGLDPAPFPATPRRRPRSRRSRAA